MSINSMDAGMLKIAFLAAAKELESKKEWINELNVFPVPDGDTGTNMTMTIMAAANEVAALDPPTMKSLARAISSGSLRGARGNSGVILSQLFRGFTKEISEAEELTTTTLANAFVRGSETAYKAVMKPKEGTILTVAKGMSDKAVELVSQTEDVVRFMEQVIEHGDQVLSQTPEMLPVLKQAGVVDSGGQGLMVVMKGVLKGMTGQGLDFRSEAVSQVRTELPGSQVLQEADIRFGYCTEFIINLEQAYRDQEFKGYLESIGDSIVVVSDGEIVKVHVHTNDPGLTIQKALGFGPLSHIKIDNMREEHQERLFHFGQTQKQNDHAQASRAGGRDNQKPAESEKKVAFIAVSAGAGLDEIFKGIGVDRLIQGGQTMNPSTEDILKAVNSVNAETVYVLPNNKNIILAAEQARNLSTDRKVVVVPSRTVPQGIAAVVNYSPEAAVDENIRAMEQEMARVKTGQITYAVRDTMIDGMDIIQGDIMGIGDEGLLAVGKSITGTTMETLRSMVDEESELITIYCGADIHEEDARELLARAEKTFPSCEVELHDGGQPVYYYLLSVE